MLSKVQKWGNSNGVRIPKIYLDELGISTNDEVDIVLENKKIVVTKKSLKCNLKERINRYDGDYNVEDFSWDIVEGEL